MFKLSELAQINNGKCNAQDAKDNGVFPLYDRSTEVKKSDKYLFDCEAIIVPGEGANFIPRYYHGKFNLHQRCYCIHSFRNVNGKYLFYNILANKDYFKSVAVGSTVPSLRLNHFLDMPLTIHSYDQQLHIVDTIGSIDDLIENNNTIIIKLENIILNLYRKKSIEWKKQVKIGDLFKCILGGTPSTKKNEYWDGDIAWVNSGEVNKLRIVSPSRYITKDGLENSATKLLPKKTTVIAITGATLGQVSLLEIDSCTNQSVIGILENNTLKHDFIYPMMINAIKKLVLNKTGGAQQHINKNDVETFEIFVPSEIEYFEYSQIIQPIFEYQSKLILQNKELLLLKNKYLQKFFG